MPSDTGEALCVPSTPPRTHPRGLPASGASCPPHAPAKPQPQQQAIRHRLREPGGQAEHLPGFPVMSARAPPVTLPGGGCWVLRCSTRSVVPAAPTIPYADPRTVRRATRCRAVGALCRWPVSGRRSSGAGGRYRSSVLFRNDALHIGSKSAGVFFAREHSVRCLFSKTQELFHTCF